MELKFGGKLIKGVGGLYEIRIASEDAEKIRAEGVKMDGDTVLCKARGVFRHEKMTLLCGDDVTLRIDTDLMRVSDADSRGGKRGDEARAGVMIEEMLPRRNEIIRPPMANIDIIFAVFAAAKPEPALSTVDKLVTIAEYKEIEPVIVITKADLAPDAAERYAEIYRKCGFRVFIEGMGMDGGELEQFIRENADRVSVFAGASGVGKSTLMNRLFPNLGLATGEISRKTARGRHTTRHIELFPLSRQFGGEAHGYIADTPGFGMLDFVQFDFYTKDDLPYVFREFDPYIGRCRYTKCTHTKEEGCALLEAVKDGKIPPERHKSYLEFYETLKNKHEWDRK
ncbi:MAG: ribosome small subunit-dependent GTPase A [Ruminococcaceae bacterium]|nr:ribosome small subunit-dependent GTPase A [Oscillospiraceae bacterium]